MLHVSNWFHFFLVALTTIGSTTLIIRESLMTNDFHLEVFCYWQDFMAAFMHTGIKSASSDLCHGRSCWWSQHTLLPQNGITPTAAHYAGCTVVWLSLSYVLLSSPSEELNRHADMPWRSPQWSTSLTSNQTFHLLFNSWTQTNLFPVIFYFYLSIKTSSFILAPPVVLWPHIYIKNYFLLFLCHIRYLPTSSILTLSIPTLSVNSHLVNFPLCQFPLCQFPFSQCWRSENGQSGNWKLTKWELVKY